MNNKKDIAIIVATHKKYLMPSDEMYIPIHVGKEGKPDLGYIGDNTGDNISEKNANYCELTGLYWAWKNLNSDYIGLAHYRRHFSLSKKSKNPFDNVLKKDELEILLGKYQIILPKKRHYYIETLYSHYAHTHYKEHLDIVRKIIKEKYPDFLTSFDKTMKKTSGYMFNMMILPNNFMNEYCSWLFDILFELEKEINQPDLSAFQGRFYGRVSEIMLNVWLTNKIDAGEINSKSIFEMNYIYMEKINWHRKITSFLKAKLFHKKYEGSF